MSDYFEYQDGRQHRRQDRAAPAHRGAHHAPEPLERDVIDVQEHSASTTIVERIRGALLKRLRGE